MIPPLHLIMTWTQTIPLAILICVPFADEELRTSRRTAYRLCAGYFIPACVLQGAVYSAYSVDGQKNYPVDDLTITVMLAVFLCIWALLVKAPAARKVIVAGMIIHYAAALNMLSSLSGSWLLGPEEYRRQIWSVNGSMTVYGFLVVYSLLTWPLVQRFFLRILRRTDRKSVV